MELWVRSQKKKLLVQAKKIKSEIFFGEKLYSHNTNEEIISFDGYDRFYVIRANGETVGEYETEERCFEILDEIQKIIDDAPIFVKDKVKLSKEDIERALSLPVRTVFYNDDVQTLKSIVYEMPEK